MTYSQLTTTHNHANKLSAVPTIFLLGAVLHVLAQSSMLLSTWSPVSVHVRFLEAQPQSRCFVVSVACRVVEKFASTRKRIINH